MMCRTSASNPNEYPTVGPEELIEGFECCLGLEDLNLAHLAIPVEASYQNYHLDRCHPNLVVVVESASLADVERSRFHLSHSKLLPR
jgi:hypothetical protein